VLCQRPTFEKCANKQPVIYSALGTPITARLRKTDAVVAAGRFWPLRGRLASTILEFVEVFGQNVRSGRIVVRPKIGQSDLAGMAGIAHENVSRILNDRKRRELVSQLSRYYRLGNKVKLQHETDL
jgi:CRP-like cAMP-binding protein